MTQRPYVVPGAVIAAAGVTFQAGAYLPVSAVYLTKTSTERLDVLAAHPVQWRVQQAAFGAAITVLPVGVALLARRLGPRRGRGYAVASAVVFGGAAPVWAPELVQRVKDPAGSARRERDTPWFWGFVWLNLTALSLLAAAAREAGWRNLSRLDAGSTAAMAAYVAATHDLPPLLIHLVCAVNGGYLVARTEP